MKIDIEVRRKEQHSLLYAAIVYIISTSIMIIMHTINAVAEIIKIIMKRD